MHWQTGEAYEYAGWNSGEPNNDDEGCTEQYTDGAWNDSECDNAKAYVGEKIP